MFGKGVLKIIGLAMTGAIALASGAQLLSSVATVIIAFRGGDIFPLVIIIGATVMLIRLKQFLVQNTLSSIVGILAYIATGYLAVVVFVGLLPFGMFSSLVGAALTILACSVMHDPRQLNEWLATLSMDPSMSWLSRGKGGSGIVQNSSISHHLILIPANSRELVITLMRNRPLLPISLTHFNECDVLFIDTTTERTTTAQIMEILEELDIPIDGQVSPLLREAILKVPLIDEKHGLAMADYSMATEHKMIIHLMRNTPSRMIVFPSRSGVRILYPESDVPGLVSKRIPDDQLMNALVRHNYAGLKEVDDAHANTT